MINANKIMSNILSSRDNTIDYKYSLKTTPCKDYTNEFSEYSLSGEVCKIQHKQENSSR